MARTAFFVGGVAYPIPRTKTSITRKQLVPYIKRANAVVIHRPIPRAATLAELDLLEMTIPAGDMAEMSSTPNETRTPQALPDLPEYLSEITLETDGKLRTFLL